jgi:hypothetical protein
MLTHSLFYNISNVLKRWGELLHFIETECDIISDVALVTANLKRLSELVLSLFIFLFFVQNTALGNNSFGTFCWQLTDEALSMRHFFKLILNVHLDLNNFVGISWIFNLGSNLASLYVKTSL